MEAVAKIVKVFGDLKEAELSVAVKCPHCGNIDTDFIGELNLIPEELEEEWSCINCNKDFLVTAREIFKGLGESEMFGRTIEEGKPNIEIDEDNVYLRTTCQNCQNVHKFFYKDVKDIDMKPRADAEECPKCHQAIGYKVTPELKVTNLKN